MVIDRVSVNSTATPYPGHGKLAIECTPPDLDFFSILQGIQFHVNFTRTVFENREFAALIIKYLDALSLQNCVRW